MSKVSLNPIRYYDVADIYTASVDNRPLRDISDNINSLNDAINILGFYQELYASQDSEPPGGFSPYTCVALSKSNTLVPIDISISSGIVDYSALPLYLIIASLGSRLYKCISFSSTVTLPTTATGFLFESIGKALKVGPGGSLVDELYFDIYYGSLSYQQLNVGKVLTQNTFSFGGNQVNTLSDNRFLAKNRNDTTLGLITRQIDLQDSHIAVMSTILPETITSSGSSSLHTTYVNSVNGNTLLSPVSKSPVYFSYKELHIDLSTGNITTDFTSLLNDVHFAPVNILPESNDVYLLSAGVNVDSLLRFSNTYLLHAPTMSSALIETNQSISTSLSFTQDSSVVHFLPLTCGRSNLLDSIFQLDTAVLSYLTTTPATGISFHNFQSSSIDPTVGGGYLGFAVDDGLNGVDPTTFPDQNGPTDFFSGSNTLILYSKKADLNTSLGAASLYLMSDGYLVLGAPNGVFCKKTPTLGYEVTNKLYVDSAVASVAATEALLVPLAGTTAEAPITGVLRFNTLTSLSPNTVASFVTYSNTDFESNTPYRFRTSSNAFSVVQGDTTEVGSPNDFINRGYLTTQLAAVTAGVLANAVTTDTTQDITSTKTLTSGAGLIVATGAAIAINTVDTSTSGFIRTDKSTFSVQTTGAGDYVKLLSKATEVGDPVNTVVTKGYLESTSGVSVATAFGTSAVYGVWKSHSLTQVAGTTTFTDYSAFFPLSQGLPSDVDSSSTGFIGTVFSMGSDGVLTYLGDNPALFIVMSADKRIAALPPNVAFNQSLIVKNNNVVYTSSISYGGGIYWLTGVIQPTSLACSAIVPMSKNDTLGVFSQFSDVGSMSIYLLRYL